MVVGSLERVVPACDSRLKAVLPKRYVALFTEAFGD
jgi:hypothetical protein